MTSESIADDEVLAGLQVLQVEFATYKPDHYDEHRIGYGVWGAQAPGTLAPQMERTHGRFQLRIVIHGST